MINKSPTMNLDGFCKVREITQLFGLVPAYPIPKSGEKICTARFSGQRKKNYGGFCFTKVNNYRHFVETSSFDTVDHGCACSWRCGSSRRWVSFESDAEDVTSFMILGIPCPRAECSVLAPVHQSLTNALLHQS